MLIITKETLPNFVLLSVRLLVVKSSSISGCLWIPGCYKEIARARRNPRDLLNKVTKKDNNAADHLCNSSVQA
jgi:hypothetical protein